jgi:hypothetical protein
MVEFKSMSEEAATGMVGMPSGVKKKKTKQPKPKPADYEDLSSGLSGTSAGGMAGPGVSGSSKQENYFTELRQYGWDTEKLTQLKKSGFGPHDKGTALILQAERERYAASQAGLFGIHQEELGYQVQMGGGKTQSVLDVLRGPLSYKQDQVVDLQRKLISAGFLKPGDDTGIYDANTIDAYHALTLEADRHKKTPLDMLSEFHGVGDQQRAAARAAAKDPFTAPAFQPVDENALRAGVTSGLQAVYGEATPDQIQRVTQAFRVTEKTHYDSVVAAAKAEYNNEPTAGTVTDLQTPDNFTAAQEQNTTDAHVYHAVQLGNSLINFLGGH